MQSRHGWRPWVHRGVSNIHCSRIGVPGWGVSESASASTDRVGKSSAIFLGLAHVADVRFRPRRNYTSTDSAGKSELGSTLKAFFRRQDNSGAEGLRDAARIFVGLFSVKLRFLLWL